MKKNENRTGILRRFAALALLLSTLAGLTGCESTSAELKRYEEKIGLLHGQVVTDELQAELGDAPAGAVGHAVLISVCDKTERAHVFTGTGTDLAAAWKAADKAVRARMEQDPIDPQWVKVDVVYTSERIGSESLAKKVLSARHEFFRWGLAFDEDYETALLEAELNGAKIYEYEEGGIDFSYLNNYLRKAGREQLEALPEEYTMFRCRGWFCDDTDAVYEMISEDDLDYGRRDVELVDASYARELILNASQFLVEQVNEDGSFVYGMYPRFDNVIENYNVVRHASTLWSLICRYRMEPDEELADLIDSTIGYMLTQVIRSDETTAYLYEAKNDEIKLGGNGVAVVALTEYMDVFGNRKYEEVCCALGNGILTMMDQSDGTYYHVLNGDFSRKEEFRTVYYDGEATFALCRLYSLTGEQKWLDAANSAVEHFIAADYAQYKDHWVAYAMNEITKHVDDRMDYYQFALHNAQSNLEAIRDRDTTYHTYLEMLMASFEVYDRMVERGVSTGDFDVDALLETIYTRVDHQLNGYFFPEYAMYMRNPQRILHTFMVRHDGYRVRIDDVQHNIGGYYLYYKNYDKLVSFGLLDQVG